MLSRSTIGNISEDTVVENVDGSRDGVMPRLRSIDGFSVRSLDKRLLGLDVDENVDGLRDGMMLRLRSADGFSVRSLYKRSLELKVGNAEDKDDAIGDTDGLSMRLALEKTNDSPVALFKLSTILSSSKILSKASGERILSISPKGTVCFSPQKKSRVPFPEL